LKKLAWFSAFVFTIFALIPQYNTFKVMEVAQIMKIENNKSLSEKDKKFIEKLKTQILEKGKKW